MSEQQVPEFLAVGHVTYDVTPRPGLPHGRVRPGGAAGFAAATARSLGLRAAVVTSAAPAYPVGDILPGVSVHVVSSPFTTFFQNIYDARGERRQVLAGRAATITRSDIPPAWLNAPIVFLGPLVREVPPEAATWFPDACVGAGIQGWLRSWDQYGSVTEDRRPPPNLARGYRILAGSEREFDDEFVGEWARFADMVGVTRGEAGSRIHSGGRSYTIAPYRADEVDPTGAGDIWAAACLIRLAETGDMVSAARAANAAGSIAVEREGLLGAPTRDEISARMERDASETG